MSGNWRRQHRTWTQQTCLHIFGCSISNVNRQARNTPSTHTHTPGTHKHLLAALFVLVLSLVSAADISLSQHSPLALPLPSRTSYQTQILFFSSSWSLQFSLFISGFAFSFFFVIAFFILFMLLSLHFTAIALAFKHKNLQQFFVLGLTKICFAKYEG